MDFDRKSAVSSFYGAPGRRSVDALNADFPAPGQERARRDSSSSFFNPNYGARPTPSAGYNRSSYFHPGREEPVKGGLHDEEEALAGPADSWDVYADFNNAGPRYSAAFVSNNSSGYREIPASTPKYEEDLATPATNGPVEMVTVPALGPEWKKDELKAMTKTGKRERKAESRKQFWKDWNRGERGLCGPYFTRRFTAFFMFGLCCAIALVLAFTIPRVPSFAFNSDEPLLNATSPFNETVPTIFSRAPANFSFPSLVDLQANTGSNFLPLTFTKLSGQVFDLDTGMLVGTGSLGHTTVPAKAFPEIKLPMNFTYVATNDSDITWNNWYNACKNTALYANGTRPGLKFRLVLDMNIFGLASHPTASTQITDAPCPIELPQNSV
ncbi:hypothetical protein GLOTRDRAFT_116588 [Gloeophyllum trabeum ATCC 11539]|uniref:Uncharacterized protein n=1 Tax=Gloeophyllum trabeum (strain ATCC 11539 / FP-39264 / Madison 617) TaxID=670483 RepID=S7RPM3_GLOTA|nr:uncharacterized protein GLOTRDRAFT_116588 [Gloeophyllum trabeum ATCC 11539]EPQ54829.1 hypothetical protein GLOTRDRAFT_116588 [Gloeophyllum trabeum ATCC 11539]